MEGHIEIRPLWAGDGPACDAIVASLLGLRAAVTVGAVGSLLTVPWALAPPLPGLRRMPDRPIQPEPEPR